ncbi:MAG: asparagine synthase-related protein, partial [Candidatus Lokiarchaeota archaeon]
GMFAIAIFDEVKGLVLARDPLGIKPLYYGTLEGNNLYFSSEIKCLLPYIKNIRELLNGSFLLNGKELRRFYHIPRPKNYLNHSKNAIKQLDSILTESIKKRLMSDVPLGVFLSGGLDSSLITAITKKYKEGELHSFSIGFQKSQDILNARLASKHIGTVHHEQIITPTDIIKVLPKVIYHLESCDPALIRSSIPTYFVSQLASQYVKVVLSGEGADELFAGYHYLTEKNYDLDNLSNELYQITCSLHNSNLQRVDRMTMAHGLEGRVPLLDLELVNFAFKISTDLKVRESAKWVLRKVAENYLPKKIVWRAKEKFAIGTGIGQFLQDYAENNITQTEIDEEFKKSGINFISKEEFLYWKYFKNHYNRSDIIKSMGRSRSLNPGEKWVSALQ